MATVEVVDTSLLNTSSRILALSSSLIQATSLVHRIKSHGSTFPSSLPPNKQTESLTSSNPSGSSDPIKIPWTISNKYYSADVHFTVHAVQGISTHQFLGVPAVIFVWVEGQPYQDDIKRISQYMVDCEPEVCLAIKFPLTAISVVSPSQEDNNGAEDDSDVDTFLSSYGFEYIDATRESPESSDNDQRRIFPEGISRLPRVLDALSTIMWPFMRANSTDSNQRVDGRSRQRGFLYWSQGSIDNTISTIEDAVTNSDNQLLDGTEGVKLEMRELARWLEEDGLPHQDPWQSATSTGVISTSPISDEFDNGIPGAGGIRGTPVSGFDDDFTVFISAPPAGPIDADYSSASSPEKSPQNPFTFLTPVPAGAPYRSLGSVSDFGGSDNEEEVEDLDLPTEAEIQATSSRIFGTNALPQPPVFRSRDSTLQPVTDPPEAHSNVDPGEANNEPYDVAPFDLAQVLSALQEMKTEISSMENEGERRKAAAKVALGLVYGLDADAGTYTTQLEP